MISSIIQPVQNGGVPQFLTAGHITQDIQPGGSFSLGGTVTFSAVTASRLGLTAAIVTCVGSQLLAELPAQFPGIGLSVHPTPATTTFVNRYHDGFRIQYLRDRAESLHIEDVPGNWRGAPIVLLGPVAQELPLEFMALFPRRPGAIIAATPQGWLRRWDSERRVWPTPWADAEQVLPLLDVLILSHDDLLPFADGNRAEADTILTDWSLKVSLLVATDGRHGATLFQHGVAERFPAYPSTEIDPTGAGDVFAAAFLCHLYRHGDPREAVNFANCVASFSVEQVGVAGIPTPEMVQARIKPSAQ